VKYKKGDVVLRFNELSSNTFFVYQGSVRVYVENEQIKRSFLQEIKEGGSFNFVN
jgi:CRP-like cAMP-binding protein